MTDGQPGASSGVAPFGLDISTAVLDRATHIARGLFEQSSAAVTLISSGSVWHSDLRDGGSANQAPAAEYVIAGNRPLWVADALLDPKAAAHPRVAGPPYLRSYVGVPIRLPDGATPGVLSVESTSPQPYDAEKLKLLEDLSDFVADEWERANRARLHSQSVRDLDMLRTTLTALVTALPIAVVLTDKTMRVVAASPTWISNEGLGNVKVVGRTLFDLNPRLYQPSASIFEACLAGEVIAGARIPIRRSDGRLAWMQCEMKAWRDADGAIAGLVLLGSDVTELVSALKQSERSEERLNTAITLADLHVWELDYEHRKLFKAGAEDTFFVEPQTYDHLHRDIYATIDPRDRPTVQEAWRRHVEEGEPYRPEYRINRSDGKEVWVQGSIKFVTDQAGAPLRMVGAIQNITGRKRLEQALLRAKEDAEAANVAKSAFLTTMSHEIRTPLNGVLGMAQAMANDELSAIQRDRLMVVRDSGESLLAILNDMLDLSKIEAGKLELEEVEFDLGEIARGAHATFTALANKKGLSFALNMDRAEGVYLGDPTRIRQILYNLISNAVKFTKSGEIRVSIDYVDGNLIAIIADTGIGMSQDVISSLFTKFTQADTSTTRQFGGTGLGLAICKQLAGLMGGSISVASAEGAGATFTFAAPIARIGEARSRQVDAEAPAEPGTAPFGIRVLAAEDNGVNRLVLKTLLRQIGVVPVLVENGQLAVDAWEASEWDVVLMDIQMPIMDGLKATRTIRAREAALGRAHTPIIALTANAMRHQISEYLACGMDGHVAKPIEAKKLFDALEAVLDTGGEEQVEQVA